MDLCHYLDWDSDFFGYQLGVVDGHHLDRSQAERIDAWAAERHIDGLYFLADVDDQQTIRTAHRHNYLLSGIRLEVDRTIDPLPEINQPDHMRIRPVEPNDVDHLRPIARYAFTNTRFYNDPHFSDEVCADFYEAWLYNSCFRDFAAAVFVVLLDEQPVAFTTCDVDEAAQEGKFTLMAVKQGLRGQGVAWHLMTHVLHWFDQQKLTYIRLVTEGNNIHAQRLYQKIGMRSRSIKLWYHKWFID